MPKIAVTIAGQSFTVDFETGTLTGGAFTASVNGETVAVLVPDAERPVDELEWLVVNGRPYELAFDPDLRWIKAYSGIHPLEVRDLQAAVARPVSGDGRVKAPIPGVITRLLVAPGETVAPGQPLVILEAMKMENEIRAPRAGTVATLHAAAGQRVTLGQVLAEIT